MKHKDLAILQKLAKDLELEGISIRLGNVKYSNGEYNIIIDWNGSATIHQNMDKATMELIEIAERMEFII